MENGVQLLVAESRLLADRAFVPATVEVEDVQWKDVTSRRSRRQSFV